MADNSSTLTHLEAPALDASYKENFEKLIANINNNFIELETNITASSQLQSKAVGDINGLYDALLTALKITKFFDDQGNILKSTNINYYEFQNGTIHIPPTTLIDNTYYSELNKGGQTELQDYTCTFTGIYNGSSWEIKTLDNFPKIVYKNGDFVWQINGVSTSVSAKGIKGDKGEATSVSSLFTVVLGDDAAINEDGSASGSITYYYDSNGVLQTLDTNVVKSGSPVICTIQTTEGDNICSGVTSGTNFQGKKMMILPAISEEDIDYIWEEVFNS